ncbi:Conserved_hypothetical protein [Hexamita inflata]|uniref:Uncharacterized protein n=1 Tax=Hexamita inflata TaxID=28002 RepID=A0AA86NNN0_9EUKA|nr:Conserved hypothetical protein [Hexamita inflata]
MDPSVSLAFVDTLPLSCLSLDNMEIKRSTDDIPTMLKQRESLIDSVHKMEESRLQIAAAEKKVTAVYAPQIKELTLKVQQFETQIQGITIAQAPSELEVKPLIQKAIKKLQPHYDLAAALKEYGQSDEFKNYRFVKATKAPLDLYWDCEGITRVQFKDGQVAAEWVANYDAEKFEYKQQWVMPGQVFALALEETGSILKFDIACSVFYEVDYKPMDKQYGKGVAALALSADYDEEAAAAESTRILENCGAGKHKSFLKDDCKNGEFVRNFVDAALVPLVLLKDQKKIWEEYHAKLMKMKGDFEGLEFYKKFNKQPEYVAVRIYNDLKEVLNELNQIYQHPDVTAVLNDPEFELESLMNRPHIQLLERIARMHQAVKKFESDFDSEIEKTQALIKQTFDNKVQAVLDQKLVFDKQLVEVQQKQNNELEAARSSINKGFSDTVGKINTIECNLKQIMQWRDLSNEKRYVIICEKIYNENVILGERIVNENKNSKFDVISGTVSENQIAFAKLVYKEQAEHEKVEFYYEAFDPVLNQEELKPFVEKQAKKLKQYVSQQQLSFNGKTVSCSQDAIKILAKTCSSFFIQVPIDDPVSPFVEGSQYDALTKQFQVQVVTITPTIVTILIHNQFNATKSIVDQISQLKQKIMLQPQRTTLEKLTKIDPSVLKIVNLGTSLDSKFNSETLYMSSKLTISDLFIAVFQVGNGVQRDLIFVDGSDVNSWTTLYQKSILYFNYVGFLTPKPLVAQLTKQFPNCEKYYVNEVKDFTTVLIGKELILDPSTLDQFTEPDNSLQLIINSYIKQHQKETQAHLEKLLQVEKIIKDEPAENGIEIDLNEEAQEFENLQLKVEQILLQLQKPRNEKANQYQKNLRAGMVAFVKKWLEMIENGFRE